MTNILTPAIVILNKLNYSRKLFLLGIIITLTILFLSLLINEQLRQTMARSAIQAEGINHIIAVNNVIKLVQQHRGLSAVDTKESVLFSQLQQKKSQETDRAFYKLMFSLSPDMPRLTDINNLNEHAHEDDIEDLNVLWEKIKSDHGRYSPESEFNAHSILIKQLRTLLTIIADHYFLLTANDLPSYYLTNILLHGIPDTTEFMAQTRGIIVATLSNKALSDSHYHSLVELEAHLKQSTSSLQQDVIKANLYSSNLLDASSYLEFSPEQYQFTSLLHDDIYSKSFNHEPDIIWAEITLQINSLYMLMEDRIAPEILSLVKARQSEATMTFYIAVSVTFSLFLLTLYFMAALSKALINKVAEMNLAITRYSQGDIKVRIPINTQDEMRDISLAVNEMAETINQYRAKLDAESHALLTSIAKEKQSLEQLEEKSLQFISQQDALNHHAIVSITTLEGTISYVNDKFIEISGYPAEALIGSSHSILNSGSQSPAFFKDMSDTISSGKVWHGEIANKTKQGQSYWVSSSIVPYFDRQGKPTQYITISTDISHIKNLELKQREANELLQEEKIHTEEERQKAEKANQAKSEFLSAMSHELKTPLNAVLGFTQLLQNDAQNPLSTVQKESISYILTSGEHLLELVNNILELATIEAGNTALSVEPSKLSDAVDDAVTLVSSLAEKSAVTISLKSEFNVLLDVDISKLKHIITNLLSNAIKYNREQGNVDVKCINLDPQTIKFSVSDTGIGISPENHKNIFAKFDRLDQGLSTISGAGIGLAITKELVEMMGGRIGFDSVEHKGSTFWFELPISKSVASDIPQKNILYIEDNPVNSRLMSAFFNRYDEYALHLAGTAEEGLNRALEHDFDLILMDIHLPEMNGNELTQQLRRLNKYKESPIIAVSAAAMEDDLLLAQGLFNAYLTKPVQMDVLLDLIKKLL